MMQERQFRALVVDDEVPIRRLVAASLSREGFVCDHAANGIEALEQVARNKYDVVVTDLRMPNRHGHALAVDLLKLDKRPAIVIHTAVVEPKLAKDLMLRGVDDIVFKPVNFPAFAAKVKGLVRRRIEQESELERRPANRPEQNQTGSSVTLDGHKVSWTDVERKLRNVSNVLPISQAALDVYNMTCVNDCETPEIAAAIEQDGSLAAELLRIGNSSYYNPAGVKISDVAEIVLRIGRKRIGELALATNALSALTKAMLPWMDTSLAWKRSVAAGIAVELLIEQGRFTNLEKGLLLSASMSALGRVILGSLFPTHYEAMLAKCEAEGTTLLEAESSVFPRSHAQVMAHLLAKWNVPQDVYFPLKCVLDEFRSLVSMSDAVRTKVELVKLAVLVGRIVVGDWAFWDTVDLPAFTVLKRLAIDSIQDVVETTKERLEQVLEGHNQMPTGRQEKHEPVTGRLWYCSLAGERFDLLGEMLETMGIKARRCAPEEIQGLDDSVLVNCVGTTPKRLTDLIKQPSPHEMIIVCDGERLEGFKPFGPTLPLPSSYAKLRSMLCGYSSQAEK